MDDTIKTSDDVENYLGLRTLALIPLVTEDGKVLAIGYILLHIVNEQIPTTEIEIDLPEGWMNCTAPTSVTWYDIETQILRKIGLSKNDFERLYSLNTVALTDENTGDATTDGYNSAYSYNPTGAERGLEGRFYSKQGYPSSTVDKPYVDYYGDAILYPSDGVAKAGYITETAIQYVKQSDGSYKSLIELNKNKTYAKSTKPLGSVYETVNGERQQTTVLEWNIGSEVIAGVIGSSDNHQQTMNESIALALAASGATVESKGNSTKEISVTVAYSQRDSENKPIEHGTIYVTLKVNIGDLHFAYAEITGKDLSLWYQESSWKNAANADESDAIEVHLNVPTPSKTGWTAPATGWTGPTANGDDPLHGDLFYKKLSQTFKRGLINTAGLDEHFTKFVDQDFSFRLTDPESAGAKHITVAKQKLTGKENSTSAEYANTWKVSGVSGSTYLLQVREGDDEDVDSIVAVAWINPDGYASDLPAEKNLICSLVYGASSTTTTIPQEASALVYANNAYAQDILNYSGRYAQNSNDLQMVDGEYLTRENKAFTAFINMLPKSKCYDLLMPNNYFRARFLRPINIFAKDTKMYDGTNEIQKKKVADLVSVNDWRTYNVTNAATTATNNVHAPYYEINDSTFKHFFVDFAGIRTDHDLAATGTVRALDPTKVTEIENLTLASDLPSLSTLPNYFQVSEDGTEIWYKNNDANVGTFHFYVPIYVSYAFGDYWWNGTTIGNIHYTDNRAARTTPSGQGEPAEVVYYNPTALSGMTWAAIQQEKWVPRFTQKVYAIITVEQTDQSHTGSARAK